MSQKRKTYLTIIASLSILYLIQSPWSFAGLLSETKRTSRYIILSVEDFTGWVNARAVPGQIADVAKSFYKEDTVKQFGGPSVVLTNQGTALFAASKQKLRLTGTDVSVMAAYSPQSSSRAERIVQTIYGATTRMTMNRESEENEHLPFIVNATSGKSVEDGYSPNEMMFAASPKRLFFLTMKILSFLIWAITNSIKIWAVTQELWKRLQYNRIAQNSVYWIHSCPPVRTAWMTGFLWETQAS